MKRLLFILTIQLSIINVYAQWTNLGLNEFQVNDLTVYSDTIYASTDNGLYKKNISSTDTIWTSCGKQGYYITQTLVENYQTFISLIQLGNTYTTQIFKSNDAGNSFTLMTTDTSDYNDCQYLDQIAHSANNYDTLYFLNHHLKTFDGGVTWGNINNTSQTDRFIMVNPNNHSQLLIGGETGYFSAYLQYSYDLGNSWTFPSMDSFFEGDNAIYDLAIDDSIWYAAGEGVITKSTDEGENWVQLLNLWADSSPFNLYYTNIEFSPINKSVLYVTGLKSTSTNKVPLLISENKGTTWDTISYNSNAINQKIRCLTIYNSFNTDYVFLGGKGVFLYSKVVNKVNEHKFDRGLTLYPIPAQDQLYIETDRIINNIKIYNTTGLKVFEKQNGEKRLNICELPTGLYIAVIVTDNEKITRKFVKQEE